MNTEETHSHQCLLLPGNPLPEEVKLARPLPCFVILVHGVNDLGETYSAQETGICAGLNQRLHRTDLKPASYRMPPARDDSSAAAQKELHTVLEDPDAIYYRRSVDPACAWNSVIPFYWGSRTSDPPFTKNHLRVDRHGNRVDGNGAKEGGPFANATNNLVDMWADGFDGKAAGFIDVNKASNHPTHPLLHADERRYMVLAAQRLAMLVEIIHKWNPMAVVNLVAHSQGCMLSLLAQAILAKRKQRPADCLILNHPPYSLEDPLFNYLAETRIRQQTPRARMTTLRNLVQFVTQSPQTRPALTNLLDPSCNGGFTGPAGDAGSAGDQGQDVASSTPGTPAPASLLDLARDAGIIKAPKNPPYADRDNRGRVFLYFCPEDATVGLVSIQGIGWQGVPEHKDGQAILASLGPRFHQRVWTMRARKGVIPKVGKDTHYVLLKPHEKFWPDLNTFMRSTPTEDEPRILASGVGLPVPYQPNLRFGESKGHAGFLDVGPCDAATAVTNEGEHKTNYLETGKALPLVREVDGWRGRTSGPPTLGKREVQRLEQHLNAGKAEDDRIKVLSARRLDNGKLEVHYQESDKAARIRWQTKELDANSYHSSIVANPDHSQHVTAWDLAIGPARICKDKSKATTYQAWVQETRDFVRYLCTVADWRMKPAVLGDARKNGGMCRFFSEDSEHKDLLDGTALYYKTGRLPEEILLEHENLPLVQSETLLSNANDKIKTLTEKLKT